MRRTLRSALTLALLSVTALSAAGEEEKSSFEIYGQVMTDIGYSSDQLDPLWFDVVRTSRLAAFENEFGDGSEVSFSIRQSRFGTRSVVPAGDRKFITVLEWDLYGIGDQAGQTTLNLRLAYGSYGTFRAGLDYGPFMDLDVFPNTIEYWGPPGLAFLNNIMVRWMPVRGPSRFSIALEAPGASGDGGQFTGAPAIADVHPRKKFPALSAEYRFGRPWGHVEVAGILRQIAWEDFGNDPVDLSGEDLGWGVNLSSVVRLGKRRAARGQIVYGEGIQNYMLDPTVDVGIDRDPAAPGAIGPDDVKAIGVLGLSLFYDHRWNARFSSTAGFSLQDNDNLAGQSDSAFARGTYALLNLLHYPAPSVMYGLELQYGKRENFADGWSAEVYRVQFSFRYHFSRLFQED
jgi:hypothetical protein